MSLGTCGLGTEPSVAIFCKSKTNNKIANHTYIKIVLTIYNLIFLKGFHEYSLILGN